MFPKYSVPITLLTLPCIFVSSLCAGTLAEDSLHIAAYHEKMETGDTAAARAVLRTLSENPDDELARKANFLLAKMALDAGDFEGVHEAIALGVPETLGDWATYWEALAFQKADRSTEAAVSFACLAADSFSILAEEALWHLAALTLEKGFIDSTIRLVHHYRLRFPDGAHSQEMELLEASALVLLQDYDEAVECLFRAELMNPTTQAGKQAEFKRLSFRQLYGFEPRSWTPDEIRLRLEALSRAQSYETALGWVEELLLRKPSPVLEDILLYWKGRLLAKTGKHRAAIAALTEHGSKFPESSNADEALLEFGRSAFSSNEDTLAEATLRLVAERKKDIPSSAEAMRLLGILYADAHEFQKARAVFEELVAFAPEPSARREALWRLGWVLWDMSLFADAENTWMQLGNIAEGSDYAPAVLYWRGRCFEKLGQARLAQEFLAQTSASFPFSYYSVLASLKTFPSPSFLKAQEAACYEPLLCENSDGNHPHFEKFCLLEHLGLSELALREWPSVREEIGESSGLWWRQVVLRHRLGEPMQASRILRDRLNLCLLRGDPKLPELFWRIAYPVDFDDIIKKYCSIRSLDVHFVLGLICQESYFQANAVSSAGATGLMQLVPQTARRLAPKVGLSYSAARLSDPDYNIALGTAYLRELLDEFGGDTILVLAAYNAGESRAQAWDAEFGGETDVFIEHIPFRETRRFVKRVLQNAAAYRRLYPTL